MPTEEDIHKAYVSYYTHEKDRKKPHQKSRSLAQNLLRAKKRLLRMWVGGKKNRENHYLMYLRDETPGRLLEIGCGSGKRLSRLASIGWQAEGQEIDAKARTVATKKYGLHVYLGELHGLHLKSDSYDAIVMNHVIEHVHRPVELLMEIKRLLKPGGLLIVTTPNADSQGHRIFEQNWFSLDPPRHLHIFTLSSLEQLAVKAGFGSYSTWTTNVNADGVASSSLKIQTMGDMKVAESKISKLKREIIAVHFKMWTDRSLRYLPDSGEECVLRATK